MADKKKIVSVSKGTEEKKPQVLEKPEPDGLSEEDRMAAEAANAALDDYDTDMDGVGNMIGQSVDSSTEVISPKIGQTAEEKMESSSGKSSLSQITDGLRKGDTKGVLLDVADTGLVAAGTYFLASKLSNDNKLLSYGAAAAVSMAGLQASDVLRTVNGALFDKEKDPMHSVLDKWADTLDPEGSEKAKALRTSEQASQVGTDVAENVRDSLHADTERIPEKGIEGSEKKPVSESKSAAKESAASANTSRRDVEIPIKNDNVAPGMELGG